MTTQDDDLRGPAGKRVRALLSMGVVFGIGTVGTLAAWSDFATATSSAFSTGTIDIRLDGSKSRAYTTLTLSNMVPGEGIAGPVVVTNAGTIPLSYTVSAATPGGSPALAGQLRLAIHAGTGATNSTSGGMRTGTCTGARIAEVPLAAGSVTVIATRRPLSPSGTEPLCAAVRLVNTAPVNVQNQLVSAVTLTFGADSAAQP